MPKRDGDDAAGRADGAHGVEHRIASADDIHSGAFQRLPERVFLGLAIQM